MKVYLDHAATTYVSGEVLEYMLPYFNKTYGNPNSLHSFGREARKVVDISRAAVASALNCKDSEIYFTSGGTESDNWALRGAAYANLKKGNHIITTKIEHHAVLSCCKALEKEGFNITYLDVNSEGLVELDTLKNAITDKTTLISVMFANNEMGAIQPIKEVGKFCKEKGIVFHTDAVQAIGAEDIDIVDMNIDLLSLSAHKFYGPKGIGALYIRNGLKIDKLIYGGAQERNMRGGTTNTPLIAGLGKAIETAVLNREKNNEKIRKLRDYLIKRIESEIPYSVFNGHRAQRLSNNANFSFEFIEGESILISMDLKGIALSSGSACTSGSLEPSHVLLALGVPMATAHGSIRFSLGIENTKEEIDYTVDNLKSIIENLRKMSPLFKSERGEVKKV
ncbi:cysteine desulfurylase family member [Holotrichia oblita]|nr:cysteine desulfurylase family member [Holotrichia oblita]